MSEDVVRVLLAAGPIGIALIVVLAVVLNPDKAARWAEIVWALISKLWRAGDRRAVQYGLQARINGFTREIARETGRREHIETSVQWAPRDEEVVGPETDADREPLSAIVVRSAYAALDRAGGLTMLVAWVKCLVPARAV